MIPAIELTAYVVLGLLVYKFVLGTMSLMLGFVAKKTETKLDDELVGLLNKMANLGKKSVDLIK